MRTLFGCMTYNLASPDILASLDNQMPPLLPFTSFPIVGNFVFCDTRIWEATSGACITTLLEHTGAVRSVAFRPDGNFIVSGSADTTVR